MPVVVFTVLDWIFCFTPSTRTTTSSIPDSVLLVLTVIVTVFSTSPPTTLITALVLFLSTTVNLTVLECEAL